MTIRRLGDADNAGAYALQCEYLGGVPFDRWETLRRKYPELFVVCIHEGKVVGLCYGWPFIEDRPDAVGELLLHGIAVSEPYARRGWGGLLLAQFEENAARTGPWIVSVGSAGGYVERFYEKRGYPPARFLVRIPAARPIPEALRRRHEIVRERVEGDDRLLLVRIERIDEGLRRRLRAEFDAGEVIVIFEKPLSP